MDKRTELLLINELEKLTTSMDVPVFRRSDPGWLLRNVIFNNKDHPNLDKVIKICKQLLS